MDTLQELDYLELLFSDNCNHHEATEVINLPDFTVIASRLIEDAGSVIAFQVRRVYGWNNSRLDSCACLFDCYNNLTIGLWYDDTLVLYQKKDSRYIRFVYFIEDRQSRTYYNLVDICIEGKEWQRCSQGCYGWS